MSQDKRRRLAARSMTVAELVTGISRLDHAIAVERNAMVRASYQSQRQILIAEKRQRLAATESLVAACAKDAAS